MQPNRLLQLFSTLPGASQRAPPPAFHILAKDIFLNRGATHFTLGLRPCIISSFLLQIYLLPPLQNYPVAPLNRLLQLVSTLPKIGRVQVAVQ